MPWHSFHTGLVTRDKGTFFPLGERSQIRMPIHLVELDVCLPSLSGQFSSCLRAENALRRCAVTIQAVAPGHLLVAYAESTIISFTALF